jgi:transcription elongation factor S-II
VLSKEIVKLWKDKIEENKKKRKREDGEGVKKEEEGKGQDIKRVKAEGKLAVASFSARRPGQASWSLTAEVVTITEPAASASSPAGSSGSSPSDLKTKTEDLKPKPEDPSTSTSDPAQTAKSPPQRPPLSTIDSDRKEPRTAKKDGIVDKLKADPNDGDDFRHKIVVQFYDALASDSTAEKKILTERAQGIERVVWEKSNESTGNEYRQSELDERVRGVGDLEVRRDVQVFGSYCADWHDMEDRRAGRNMVC